MIEQTENRIFFWNLGCAMCIVQTLNLHWGWSIQGIPRCADRICFSARTGSCMDSIYFERPQSSRSPTRCNTGLQGTYRCYHLTPHKCHIWPERLRRQSCTTATIIPTQSKHKDIASTKQLQKSRWYATCCIKLSVRCSRNTETCHIKPWTMNPYEIEGEGHSRRRRRPMKTNDARSVATTHVAVVTGWNEFRMISWVLTCNLVAA